MRNHLKPISILVLLIFTVTGCATVNVPDLGDEGYKIEDDEARMHKRGDELSEKLDDSDYIYDDIRFEKYINKLAQKFLSHYPFEHNIDFKVRVLAESDINAFAVPNGRIFFHTGLIALAESEAQLAAVLAHEIVHVLERHGLKTKRSVYNKTAFMSTFGVFGLGGLLIQFGGLSSIYGYSQKLEQRADVRAFDMLKESGYDVNEMPKMYRLLSENLVKQDRNPNYFFSTHPKVRRRIRIYEELIEEEGLSNSGGIVTSDEFESFIDEIVIKHIEMCLKKGYFTLALSSAQRMEKKHPQTPEPYFYKAETYRQWQDRNMNLRKKDDDFQKAIEAYKLAVEKDKNYAPAYKGLGRIYQKQKKHHQAVEVYKTYLALDGESSDAAYIRSYVNNQKIL